MQGHQEKPTEKDELARLAQLNEEQLNKEVNKIKESTTLSNDALVEFHNSLTLEREKTYAENISITLFNGLLKEAEEEKIANAAAQSLEETKKTAIRTEEEEEERKKKKEKEEKFRSTGGDSSIDPNDVLDFMRNKSPEELSQLINKHSSIPSSLIVLSIKNISMNQLASMAPFVSDFSAITNAIDKMGNRETDNKQTRESLEKLSKDLKNLQSLMEKMAGWNAKPTTDDQKLQNYELLKNMKEQLNTINSSDPDNVLAKTILEGNKDLKKIHDALSKKIDNELDKIDPKIIERYEQDKERSKGNNKTPEQIAEKIGDFAKQMSFSSGMISAGLRFASMDQLSKEAGSFADRINDAISVINKFSMTCDGNEATKSEFDKLSNSLKETQDLLRKLGDENEGWKKNPKGDDVRHNHDLLQQMKKQLDAIEKNPLAKDAAALEDVQKVTKALQTKINKESEKLEKIDPSLKTKTATITPIKPPPYDSDKGTKYSLDHMAAAEFKNVNKLGTTRDGQTHHFTKDDKPIFDFNTDTREITLHNTDEKTMALAADFAKNVLKNEDLQVATTPENMSTMQDSFKQAELTATFKELVTTPAETAAPSEAKALEKDKAEEKIDQDAGPSNKPSMGPSMSGA